MRTLEGLRLLGQRDEYEPFPERDGDGVERKLARIESRTAVAAGSGPQTPVG